VFLAESFSLYSPFSITIQLWRGLLTLLKITTGTQRMQDCASVLEHLPTFSGRILLWIFGT